MFVVTFRQMTESTDFYRKVGGRLRAARQRAELSQAALGARLGVTAGAINRYEMGGRRVPLRDVPRLASILGIAPGVLFGETAGQQRGGAAHRAGEVREESPIYGRSRTRRRRTARHYAASLTASQLRMLAHRAGLKPDAETQSLRRYAELIAEDLAKRTARP